jgi:hypothetical protein
VETIVYKNKYMLIHVIKIYSLNYNSFSLTAIKLIIINTKNSNILKDSKVDIS